MFYRNPQGQGTKKSPVIPKLLFESEKHMLCKIDFPAGLDDKYFLFAVPYLHMSGQEKRVNCG